MSEEELLVEEPEVHCIHSEMVEIDKVKPNPMNANVHPDDQIKMLAGVLRVNGWREAIVVSKLSGMVVKGHGRLLTARHLKLKKVPVEYQDYRDEQSELADLIADNRIAQHSYVDALGLGKLLRKINEKGQSSLGYTQEEIGLFMAAEYVAPVATDRKFIVLETLKMTKESKAVITRAVQKFCLRLGKEIDWGEALASICIQWEAGQPTMPEPVVPEPKKEKPIEAKTQVANIVDDKVVVFAVKYIAATTIDGEEVSVIRPQDGGEKYYSNDKVFIGVARQTLSAEGKSIYKVSAVVESIKGRLWIKDIEKA